MHEHVIHEKKAAKDYDGDGKIESGKDEYFGSKDKAIKKAMAKRVKKESLSDWRGDLSDLIEIVAEPEEKAEKKVKESNVKNKVVINPKISEAIEEIGGEVLEHHQKDADGNTIPHDDVNEGQVKKEIKALSTAAKTLKGKNVAKADKIEEGKGNKNCGCGQDPCVTYGKKADAKESLEFFRRFRGIDEAKRDLGDRLHRKRKLYDRTVPKAMEYARREGEAAGHARYRMGQLDREMDKVKDKMKKEN